MADNNSQANKAILEQQERTTPPSEAPPLAPEGAQGMQPMDPTKGLPLWMVYPAKQALYLRAPDGKILQCPIPVAVDIPSAPGGKYRLIVPVDFEILQGEGVPVQNLLFGAPDGTYHSWFIPHNPPSLDGPGVYMGDPATRGTMVQ
ncbi:hypothetical protein VTO42DRAFT_7168 [Malbranchea cinnamomea]